MTTKSRPRDYQRSKIYGSESAVRDRYGKGTTYESVDEVQSFVNRVCYSDWMMSRIGHAPSIEVEDGRGRRSGCGGLHNHSNPGVICGFIRLPRFSRYQRYILHEVAHVLIDGRLGDGAVPWHGAEFARVLVDLVSEFSDDPRDGVILKWEIIAQGGDVHPWDSYDVLMPTRNR